MLGDAGANPLGGVLGLGLALSLDETWRLVAIGVLVLLNLASEKWSFSKLIERVRAAPGLRHVGPTSSRKRKDARRLGGCPRRRANVRRLPLNRSGQGFPPGLRGRHQVVALARERLLLVVELRTEDWWRSTYS